MEFSDQEQKKHCECGEKCVCRHCGMPMKSEADFGTEEDGGKNCDYCIHCYQNGILTADNKAD